MKTSFYSIGRKIEAKYEDELIRFLSLIKTKYKLQLSRANLNRTLSSRQ